MFFTYDAYVTAYALILNKYFIPISIRKKDESQMRYTENFPLSLFDSIKKSYLSEISDFLFLTAKNEVYVQVSFSIFSLYFALLNE